MYEEWEARPNWGERITPDFVQAFNDEKLLPVADLDKGFMRPSYPNQIVVSYFQAGLVCQMIDRQWGPEKLTAMLELFAADATTADTIRQALEIEPEEFDERFQEFIKKRLGPLAGDGLKAWRAKMKDLLTAAGKEDWDAVIERAPQVEELYPDYVDSGNPYTLAARAYEEKGEREQAVAKLETYFKRGGRNPSALKELAGRLQEAGRRQDAIDVREEMLWINPLDEELHRDLGDDLLAEGRLPEAAREFQALLAMEPLDKAAANFRLAETYHKMKDPKRTRRHLLLALEAAPSYKPAQKLLLEITNK
jgi:tetratricopeptide (TPR) repeat protein